MEKKGLRNWVMKINGHSSSFDISLVTGRHIIQIAIVCVYLSRGEGSTRQGFSHYLALITVSISLKLILIDTDIHVYTLIQHIY